jgi:hypothetical protein
MTDSTCAECGAPLEAGRSCRDYFHHMLGVESEVTGAQGGEPHFFAVGSYNLQHPSSFVPAALVGLHRTVADVLAGRATIAEARRRAGAGAPGSTRVHRDRSTPDSPDEERLRRDWPTQWPRTVRYVIAGGTTEYVVRVRELAQSVVETLERTIAATRTGRA